MTTSKMKLHVVVEINFAFFLQNINIGIGTIHNLWCLVSEYHVDTLNLAKAIPNAKAVAMSMLSGHLINIHEPLI